MNKPLLKSIAIASWFMSGTSLVPAIQNSNIKFGILSLITMIFGWICILILTKIKHE